MELQQYWQAIQENACTQCMHGDGKGHCKLPAKHECALKVFFPEIVLTVVNAKTDSLETFGNLMHRHICILCDWQMPDMSCKLRNQQTCALEQYQVLIIETIKNVRQQLERNEIGAALG